MNDLENKGLIYGCKIARTASVITHLFLADDSYLFFRVNREECSFIKEGLKAYEKASGQKVNFHMSSVKFSPNIPKEVKGLFNSLLAIPLANQIKTYLGLPAIMGRNKTSIFSFVKDWVRRRINGWHTKFLFRAGKEVLIKTVAQALPLLCHEYISAPKDSCAMT